MLAVVPWFPADEVLFADEEDLGPVELVEAVIEEEQRYVAWLNRYATSNSGNHHRSTVNVPGVVREGAGAFFRSGR